MYNLIKSRVQLLRRPSFIYHVGNRTYKWFSPAGANHKIAELNGNRNALKADFWKDEVIEVEPKLFCFAMARGEPVTHINAERADQYVELKLQQALSYPKQAACNGVEFKQLRALGPKPINIMLLEKAEEKLQSVYLPITSTHGDLHINNMVFLDREIKLIDWSMFNDKGTFVTDFIHYYNYQDKVLRKESWTKTILKEQSYMNVLAKKLNTTLPLLKLAYSIARISGEVVQARSISQIPDTQIEKYNYVLTHILDEI